MEIQFLKKLSSGFKQFILKLLVFSVLFIAVTGILGPWIISTKLLYGFHFFIYANMGKMVLFSAIVFLILTRKNIQEIKKFEYKKYNLIFIGISILLIPLFFIVATSLLQEKSFFSNIFLSLYAHVIAILIPVLLGIGVFGINFIKYFISKFKKEILICFVLSIFFYFAIFQVWKLWPYLSGVVLKSVAFLLSLHISHVKEAGNFILVVDNFAVRIEQACSGLDSIFLFTSLYLLIALVDWNEFNKKKLIVTYFFALLGVFAVNILRVYLLILVGVYINPHLALQLFHTYLGMMLFIIYFFFFWQKAYGWLKTK